MTAFLFLKLKKIIILICIPNNSSLQWFSLKYQQNSLKRLGT